MVTDETCARCTAPAVRTLGSEAFCRLHLEAILGPIRERVIGRLELPEGFNGRGRIVTAEHSEFGPGNFGLECDQCGATWTGEPDRQCAYCLRSYELMVDHQAAMVLRPPTIQPTSSDYLAHMQAWSERLLRAVEAGLVDADAADAAWRREVGRNDAA